MSWTDGTAGRMPWEHDGENEQWLPPPPALSADDGEEAGAPWALGREEADPSAETLAALLAALRDLKDTLERRLQVPRLGPGAIRFQWRDRHVQLTALTGTVYEVTCPACGRPWIAEMSGEPGEHTLVGYPEQPTIRPGLRCPYRAALSYRVGGPCTWAVLVTNGIAVDITSKEAP